MQDSLLLLWLAALPLMGSPGPANISLAATATAFGIRRSLAWFAGIAAGTATVLLMIAAGITGLLLAQPVLVGGLALLAGLYILYLAWRIATAPVAARALPDAAPPRFLPAYLLAIANPKAFAAIGAVYAGHTLLPGTPLADALAKIAALLPMIVLCGGAWLLLGAVFSRALAHPVLGRAVNIGFALMLLVSVGLALARR